MEKLIERIELAAAESDFTGAVSISVEGETVFSGAYGERDRSNHLPNTVSTRFGIASGTKLLTALGIGALVDQEQLTVGTQVGEIHEDFHTYIDPSATVAQLLTHMSGAYDYYDEDVITDFDNFFVDIPWYHLTTPTDYLPLFEGQTLKFSPGEEFSYSNGGYILLGVIIESVSGQPYREFIQEQVLSSAGMHETGYFAFNDLPENVAYGYMADGGQTNIYNLPMRGASDGGVYTTVRDLNSLWTALFASEIVSEEYTSELLAPHVTFDDGGGYGYGIYWTESQKGSKMYYIVGGDAGVGFDSAYFPEQQTAINILSNTTDGEEHLRKVIYDHLEL